MNREISQTKSSAWHARPKGRKNEKKVQIKVKSDPALTKKRKGKTCLLYTSDAADDAAIV